MVFIAFILDILLGDPAFLVRKISHPIIMIGKLISKLENKLLKSEYNDEKKYFNGIIICVLAVCTTLATSYISLFLLYKINIYLGFVIETFLCYQIFATKSLKDESMKVYSAEILDEKRKFLSYIVGRDTKSLNEEQIYKATVETIAENTTDGVVAPMMYMFLGGAPLGILYKTVNTLDSMIGYKSEQYLYFGRFSAKFDDVLNYYPARISGVLMIISAYILKFNGKNALKIWKRDRKKHKSPNSGQTESVCAGAFDIELLGDAYYFGKLVKKPSIGDKNREISGEDIKNANKLMYCTSVLAIFVFSLIKIVIIGWIL